jgi:hypothetical protein
MQQQQQVLLAMAMQQQQQQMVQLGLVTGELVVLLRSRMSASAAAGMIGGW